VIFDSIAIPISKRLALLDRERNKQQAEAENRLFNMILDLTIKQLRNEDRINEAIDRVTRLESTEERGPLER
jgi:hypothetical protein